MRSDDQPTTCFVRSSSGDIDIPIILLGMEPISNVEVYIDNGSGKTRKLLHLNSCILTIQEKKALVGRHAYPNDVAELHIERDGESYDGYEEDNSYSS